MLLKVYVVVMNNEPLAHTVIGNFSNLKHKINNKWPMNGKLQQKIIADILITMFYIITIF